MSRVTTIISALIYLHHHYCLSRAVNHYRGNAVPTSQRDKRARELKRGEPRQLLAMRMRQRVAALDAKYTKELADAKAK